MESIEADVCVVGADYAGLTAARRLAQAGRTPVVLEARDRVGGRVWTRHMEDGTALDLGGTWLGPGQDAAYGLARELGVTTYPTYAAGDTVFVSARGQVSRTAAPCRRSVRCRSPAWRRACSASTRWRAPSQ
jgi:monoamine oxidase